MCNSVNIVVLSQRVPYPPIKGEKIRTFHQIKSLQRAKCCITVFCPLHEPEDNLLVEQYGSTNDVRVCAEPAGKGWLRMLKALCSGGSLSVAKFYLPKLKARLDDFLSSNSVDVLYCTSSAMAQYACTIRRDKPKVRVIVDFMDLDSDKWRRFSAVSSFPMSLIYRYEANVLRKFECKIQDTAESCLFVSQAEVNLFHQKNNSKADNLHVVGNGVELSDYYPPAAPGYSPPLTLLFTGVMDYLPNEDAICWFVNNAWGSIVKDYPDARLIVAGMKPTQSVLDLGKDKGVTVTGFVKEMLPFFHDADVFVAPFQIARGVQNKILQAFACGLPVVTTSVGAEGIDGIDGEHFLVAKTPQQFSKQIARLVTSPELYFKISKNARQLAMDEYRWEAKNRPLVRLMLGRGSRQCP